MPRPFLAAGVIACVALGCTDTKREAKHRDDVSHPTVAVASTQSTSVGPQLPSVEKPLFDRLGGNAGVTKVVEAFVALAADDPKVNFTRKGHPAAWEATPENIAHLKKRLVEFIATTTGGDVNYSGKDMVSAHKGMGVTDAEFDAAAADLKKAMDQHDVPAPEQAELLAVVNKTRAAIVEARAEHNPPDTTPAQPKPEAKPATEEPKKTVPAETPKTPEPVKTFTPGVSSNETELERVPESDEPVKGKKPSLDELNK